MTATRFAKYAPENETAAEAFATFQDAALALIDPELGSFPRRFEETFGDDFQAGHLYRDTNLNWVVAYAFDGPFELFGEIVPAPEGTADYLTLGVIVDSPDWHQFD